MSTRKLPIGITVSRTEPWFRYSRGAKGKPVYFYYGKKRSKAKARAEAITHAERWNRQLTPKIEAARKGRKTKTNKSGAVGVSIKNEKGRARGTSYRYWFARWPDRPSGIKFSILEHGDRKAFCLAMIAREQESTDRAGIEHAYQARKKSGALRSLLAGKKQKA